MSHIDATAENPEPTQALRSYDQRGDVDAVRELVRRRINAALRHKTPGDHRANFELYPVIGEQGNWAGTIRYNIVTRGVDGECIDNVSQSRSGRLRLLPYGGHGWRRYDAAEQARHPIAPRKQQPAHHDPNERNLPPWAPT